MKSVVALALGIFLGLKYAETRALRAALSDERLEDILEEWS